MTEKAQGEFLYPLAYDTNLNIESLSAVSSNRSSQLSDDLERFSNSSGLLAGDGGNELGVKMAYLLLGQEEYLEHRSEVTHCK